MIRLKNSRLVVEIPSPGEGVNCTTRFSRSAFISQVTLDGQYQFCCPEPVRAYLPRSGGAGLCSEIKADSLSDEVAAGAYFPKFGVGLLKKPDEAPYSFRRRYECRPFDIKVEAAQTTAVFETQPAPCQGYALRDKRIVELKDNTLTVFYEFENMGKKSMTLREYCHNFVTLEELPLGPDYYLEVAAAPQDGCVSQEPEGVIYGKGNGFTYRDYDEHPCSVFVKPEDIAEKDFYWRLTNRCSPCIISEQTSFQPSGILIWSVDFNISPECCHTFSIAPGECVCYWRKWTFMDGK